MEVDYKCSDRHCYWNKYKKNIDWGYYSASNGNCSFCKNECSKDSDCGAVECGGNINYCSWWKIGKCATEEERAVEHTRHKTCTKL